MSRPNDRAGAATPFATAQFGSCEINGGGSKVVDQQIFGFDSGADDSLSIEHEGNFRCHRSFYASAKFGTYSSGAQRGISWREDIR